MITRFRIEAIDPDAETVEEEVTMASMAMLGHVSTDGSDWECTDDKVVPIEKDGQATMYARKVFRRMDKEEPR